MGFQNLRNNSQVYILHKNGLPKLEIAKVTNMGIPMPKYLTGNYLNLEMVLDITAQVDNVETNFQKLPATLEVVDYDNYTIISCSRDAMILEVLNMRIKSQDILDSIEEHKDVVEGCEKILAQLEPEKTRSVQEIKELRELVNSMMQMMLKLIDQK